MQCAWLMCVSLTVFFHFLAFSNVFLNTCQKPELFHPLFHYFCNQSFVQEALGLRFTFSVIRNNSFRGYAESVWPAKGHQESFQGISGNSNSLLPFPNLTLCPRYHTGVSNMWIVLSNRKHCQLLGVLSALAQLANIRRENAELYGVRSFRRRFLQVSPLWKAQERAKTGRVASWQLDARIISAQCIQKC